MSDRAFSHPPAADRLNDRLLFAWYPLLADRIAQSALGTAHEFAPAHSRLGQDVH